MGRGRQRSVGWKKSEFCLISTGLSCDGCEARDFNEVMFQPGPHTLVCVLQPLCQWDLGHVHDPRGVVSDL